MDNAEIGRRVAAARGYAGETIESFAPKMGISAPTLRAYEQGRLGGYGKSDQTRRALLEQVQETISVPPEILGLSPPSEQAAVAILSRLSVVEDQLRRMPEELRTELHAAIAEAPALRADQQQPQEPDDSAEEDTGG